MAVGRDESGRFKKGEYTGGPGRPSRETEKYFLELFRSSVSDADFKAVIEALVKAAKRGNTAATKIILDYLMGPPVQRTENDNNNHGAYTLMIVGSDGKPHSV
jgi:hypothetical protein